MDVAAFDVAQAAIAQPDLGPGVEPQSGDQGMARALMEQSSAITALVAHLTSGGDVLNDLSSSSSGSAGVNTRGVARREKMQRDLAEGNSQYFLAVQQQLFKKMFPARPVPKREEDLIGAGVSLTTYLERFGGYRHSKENAMIMWMLAHCMDAAADGNMHMVKEYLALTTACIEQASMDGNWSIAYVLSLLEEPPSQVYTDRASNVSALGRPFAALVPPQWAAVSLAFLKEMELLSNKKQETKPSKPSQSRTDESGNPSPTKRRPKFPKKPKAGADPPAKE